MHRVPDRRYFTPDQWSLIRRSAAWLLCAPGRCTRTILFCNIMLDSSSSARLDILDVIGSNLLYRAASTIEACRRSPIPSRCIYGCALQRPIYIFRHALPCDSQGKYSGWPRARTWMRESRRLDNKSGSNVNKILWKRPGERLSFILFPGSIWDCPRGAGCFQEPLDYIIDLLR